MSTALDVADIARWGARHGLAEPQRPLSQAWYQLADAAGEIADRAVLYGTPITLPVVVAGGALEPADLPAIAAAARVVADQAAAGSVEAWEWDALAAAAEAVQKRMGSDSDFYVTLLY